MFVKLSQQKSIKKSLNNQQRGFTLMEVMVSISIFAIIITIGIGSLLTIFKTLQKTRADRQTLDSVSYMMDTMTRQMRTAQKITVNSSDEVEIINQDQVSAPDVQPIIFRFTPNQLDQNDNEYGKLVMIDENGIQYDLTPSDFNIDNVTFEQFGEINDQQGMIGIHIDGTTNKNGRDATSSRILLQTIVSKRILDYDVNAQLRTLPTNSNPDSIVQ